MAETEYVDALFAGKYAALDPVDPLTILWVDAPGSDIGLIEVSQPDDRYLLRFVEANRIVCFLGAPDIPLNGAARCFETRATDAHGPSESPLVGVWSNGMTSAQVEYIQDGKHWFSCALTLVKR